MQTTALISALLALGATKPLTITGTGPGEAGSTSPGLVIEGIGRGSAAERAALVVGDVLTSWALQEAPAGLLRRGELRTPFDVDDVETEYAPRGVATLSGSRGGRALSARLGPGAWRLDVHPALLDRPLAEYREGQALLAAKDGKGAASRWRTLARALEESGRRGDACWLWTRVASAWTAAGSPEEASTAYGEALRIARDSGTPLLVARVLAARGRAEEKANDFRGASASYEAALRVAEEVAPAGLSTAGYKTALGRVLVWSAEQDRATRLLEESLAILRNAVPGSWPVAQTLNVLGLLERTRGHLAEAETRHREALSVVQEILPDSLEIAETLRLLGLVHWTRGDAAAADQLYKRALEMQEKLAPDTLDVAWTLTVLGRAAETQGATATAERLQQRALAMAERLAPESLDVARPLTHLGILRRDQGDLDAAEELLRRALVIRARLAPDSIEDAHTQALLGTVLLKRGDLSQAEDYFKKALVTRQRLAAGSSWEANTLHDLGVVQRRRGDIDGAGDFFRRAILALEAQNTNLGGLDEIRSRYRGRYHDHYADYITVLLARGRVAEAFHILERSRARVLLAMLPERELRPADRPAELSAALERLDAEYDEVQTAIYQLAPRQVDVLEKLLDRQGRLRETRAETVRRIREASPHFSSLRHLEPLDLAATRAVLDPGTLLLAYHLGPEGSQLFAVTSSHGTPADPRRQVDAPARSPAGEGCSVFTLPIGAQSLREKILEFRKLLQQPRHDGGSWAAASRELYDLLVRPAQALVERSDRILVSAEGPLQLLPFAALVTSAERRHARTPRAARFLVEQKPVHYVLSATLYAEIQRLRSEQVSPAGWRIAVFGNPRQDREPAPDKTVPGAQRGLGPSGGPLDLLPESGREAREIARLFPGQATLYLGDEATETRVIEASEHATHVHLACHALLDAHSPLNSALVLTPSGRAQPARDNGLLQAWEIVEKLRSSADLVTLSGCDTGLGNDVGAEGLLGLTRAFQYAGARSIVASLWAVPDKSTADLMTRFYRHLKDGRTKDEALRATQLEFIHAAPPATGQYDRALPFRWAAFQLIGDWR